MENVIGSNIKALREARGWSKAELGRRVKRTRATVWDWENGLKNPGTESLIRLAQVFGVTLDQLVFSPAQRKELQEAFRDIAT